MLPETMDTATPSHLDRRSTVRQAVRQLLEANPEFAALPPDKRRALASNLVQLTETKLDLMEEEADATGQLATAMEFDPAANRQLASVAQDTLEGVAFPRFVTELVNGVFKGLIDANAQQLQSYVDMVSGVTSASAGSSAATGAEQARVWLVQQFPDSYEMGASQDEWGEEDENGATIVRLRDGREAPSREDIAAILELEGEGAEGFDAEEPEEGLLAKVRAFLSRKRQKVIASLLTLGMNRLVIDHGKIEAGMNFSIDAHSAAEENRARRHEFKHSSTVGGSVGFGPWSVNASMTNSIGIVSTNQTHRSEEMNQSLNMNAGVVLHFHSDYLPLNQLAAADSVQRIRAVSLNPNAPPRQAPTARQPSSARTAADTVVNTPIQHASAGTPPPVRRQSGDGDSSSSSSQTDSNAATRSSDSATREAPPSRSDSRSSTDAAASSDRSSPSATTPTTSSSETPRASTDSSASTPAAGATPASDARPSS